MIEFKIGVTIVLAITALVSTVMSLYKLVDRPCGWEPPAARLSITFAVCILIFAIWAGVPVR